ncbi:dTDP-4-amino-4,6-dideoxygalactose transaminase [Paenibacillus shirakamiensis]|uniref:dTDP-4-amino-4,6-dideoxygalactose transaminase n=1 Tax=Paenibacillus shirakamiensis TaxID=1265935 RepID=A0ABS4JGN7_9BACL|nr:DegT/DnrJ/EryC1/StrS family aminotransferase [Paenibacillus shirakamiensis]MBP2000266.1 dTDP-4-amino-4,6-dideoxygalactose transaminase [Paenibacillus shirakamiensis]
MSVAFFSGAKSFKEQWPLISQRLDQVIDEGRFTNGPAVQELEKALEVFTGAKHCIAVGNATDALIIMLRAAGIGVGDEVIVPCYSFFASASSIALVGATPVFCDIDAATYMIDVNQIEEKITPRTRAIMPVHLFTQLADMTAIHKIAQKHELLVLEDSAEAISMFHDGQHAGLIGDAGVISFFPTKTLGAIGDAGLVLTNNDDIAKQARQLRIHGQEESVPYIHQIVGFNSKMDDVQASILLVRLQFLQKEIARRAYLAASYDAELRDIPQVQTPVIRERGDESANAVYYVYLIETEDRDGLVDYLTQQGIGTEVYYPHPLHTQPCFKHLGYKQGDMPHAERASSRAVGLPMYPDVTDEQLAEVCGHIRQYFQKGEQ